MQTMPSFSRKHDFPVREHAEPDYAAIAHNAEFLAVKRRLLRFTVRMTALFLVWYLGYVLLAAYAHDFMSQRVTGNVTVGLVLGLSQFATTVVIMLCYLRFARRRVDPAVDELRAKAGAAAR